MKTNQSYDNYIYIYKILTRTKSPTARPTITPIFSPGVERTEGDVLFGGLLYPIIVVE